MRASIARDDPQPAQTQRSPSCVAFAAIVALLPAVAPFARDTAASALLLMTHHVVEAALVDDEGVLVQVAQIEAPIVDHIAFLHDIRALGGHVCRCFLTELLELDVAVWGGGRAEPLQDAGLGKEE